MSLRNQKMGFVGCGYIGEAILAGALSHRLVQARSVFVVEPVAKKQSQIRKRYRVQIEPSLHALCRKTSVVILAVKPQQLSEVAHEMKTVLSRNHLVISILAGTTTRKLRQVFGKKPRLARAMPNLGASVGAAVTAIAQDSPASRQDLKIVQTIFEGCGEVVFLPEKHMNLVTALSGSGPAYYFFLTEQLIQAGKRHGLNEKTAHCLAVQTAHAASLLMKTHHISPEQLRKQVTSKKGTTDAAIKVLEKKGWRKAIHAAVLKAMKRAKQLSRLT